MKRRWADIVKLEPHGLSFFELILRFHRLVDQELAFDKKGGYRRVKAGRIGAFRRARSA